MRPELTGDLDFFSPVYVEVSGLFYFCAESLAVAANMINYLRHCRLHHFQMAQVLRAMVVIHHITARPSHIPRGRYFRGYL